MLVGQVLTLVLLSLGLIATYLVLKLKKININGLVYKITSGVLAVVFFFRFMWEEDALEEVYMLTNSPISSQALTVVSIVLNWLLYAAVLLVILHPFFKNAKCTVLVKYYSFIVALLCTAFLTTVTKGIVGANAYEGFNVRTLLIGVELAILLTYSFVVFMENGKFRVEKRHLTAFIYIIPMLLFIMQPYVPSALFGQASALIVLNDLKLWHRVFIYFAFIVPLIIFFVLKNKRYDTKRLVLLYIALETLLVFLSSHRFASWLVISSWPLHLCHTAMYILPLCLIFKWDKLFYFTYFINVLGAFLAMAMPNMEGNVLSFSIMHFWSNHYFAFFMPLLCVGLKMFRRPRLKEFIYSAVAFSIYFFLIVFINSWFTSMGHSSDFFYLNSDFIAEKLGQWAENLRNVTVTVKMGSLELIFYPLYQVIYWAAYIALSAGMWFLYELVYNFTDTLKDMANRRKQYKLDELALATQLNGRKKEEPLNMENTNKMILRNFSKIYGKSNVYAVKDANLEINGGEIFGFLGPNGAGKSTIIKSIVGIQPITGGSIEICGYDANKQAVMAKKQIGFVPDHYALYEKLTGREYINYIADLYEVGKEDRDKRINRYVEIFELQTAFDNQMKTYSHGMKQKIAIMAALVHNPKVWILDEPLTGLDPNSIFQVKECMKQHAKEGNIVFFSSHIIDVVEKICDRIGIIKKGQIQCVKTIKEIEASGTTLEDFYMDIINNKVVEAIPVKPDKGAKKTEVTAETEAKKEEPVNQVAAEEQPKQTKVKPAKIKKQKSAKKPKGETND